MLRRLAAAVSPSLRRSLCTARSRPPWALVNIEVALDASGAPSPGPGMRASFDLKAATCVSHLSVPSRFVDPRGDAMDFLSGGVRGASSDGLLLLEFIDGRHCPRSLHEVVVDGGVERDVRLFVCNPLSGQLFGLPAPDTAVPKKSTPFGLLTQSDSDRYVVAQLSYRDGDRCRVVRRFLSETGRWEETPLAAAMQAHAEPERPMLIDHEVVAFGDRLWWPDVAWGVCSVDPFSDRPERRFVGLPDCTVMSAPSVGGLAGRAILRRHRRMGVSQGKLRFVEAHRCSNRHEPFVISSFSLDVESFSWTLDHSIAIETSARTWIAAIDPFKANVVYLQLGESDALISAVDMDKGEVISSSPLAHKNACLFHPGVLSTLLPATHIPAGTLSSNKTNCDGKTLAEMLVRVDKGNKN